MRRPHTRPGRLRRLAGVAATVALALSTSASAQSMEAMEGDGLIVRVQSADLVFIDRGAEHGLGKGDYFDIVSSEMLVHPLSDSILAVTPKIVGALQVLQVYQRTSLARLVYLDGGEDPMLKPIARVRDAERVADIEKKLVRGMRVAAGMDASRRLAVIPGLYQIHIGERRKGWALLGAESLTLLGGLAYRANSNDWYDQYQNLPAGLPESDYDRYFTKAQDLRTRSNRLLWLAGALYVYNWVDILWLGDAAGVAAAPSPREPLSVGLGLHADTAQPLLRLTRRF